MYAIHSQGADMENLFNNQELLYLVITSFIPITSMFDSGVILQGEIRCWSLLVAKGLSDPMQISRGSVSPLETKSLTNSFSLCFH